jgi:L-threonylcarbamoyladenylate synthase
VYASPHTAKGRTPDGNTLPSITDSRYDRVTAGGRLSLDAEVLRIHPDEPEPHLVSHVVDCLQRGEVVALPTDTFYGLAVDPVNLRAVEQIYSLKNRARHKPLSLLIADVAQGYELARNVSSDFDKLAEKFWPGPLTLVVKAGSKLPLRVTANTGNVALRVPEAAICRAVVAELGLPITATSANLRGLPECTYAACVREQFGEKIPLIVDGGPTARSVATTIVDLSGGTNSWMILREGAIPTHEIALALQR